MLPILQSVVALGLEMGYTTMALRISRGEHVSTDTLFSGFRRFFPLLWAQILLSVMYMGLGFLCIYPSAYIFLLLPASEKFYEIFTPLMESATVLSGTITLDDATAAALFLLLLIPMHYRYRMLIYRLIDQPRPGALRAMRESRSMMYRNRFSLFRLDLSLWWFYLLQTLITVICYGDVLLAMAGVTLPWSGTVSYFLFMGISLIVQFAVYYFFMNRVAVTYAVAYEALLPKKKETQEVPQVPAVPWQNQY